MAGKGGYQAPAHPAAVSGPGKLSARTDGRPGTKQAIRDITGGDYGDASEFRQLQQSAPLAQASGAGGPSSSAVPAGPQVTPMGAPTTMPGTPVTAGAAMGEGPGTAAIGAAQNPADAIHADAASLAQYMPALVRAAQSDDASPEFRRFVRQLFAKS